VERTREFGSSRPTTVGDLGKAHQIHAAVNNYQAENQSTMKTNSFSPSAIKRETTIDTIDLVVPVDIPRNLIVGHKFMSILEKLYKRQKDMKLMEMLRNTKLDL
jgi:hypothetical protein